EGMHGRWLASVVPDRTAAGQPGLRRLGASCKNCSKSLNCGGRSQRLGRASRVPVGGMDATRRWIPYCGEAPGPELWLARWNLDPVLLAALALMALALWWPGTRPRPAWRWAWGLAVLLYVSPLCALSSAFFTVRVAHHMALVLAVAPLLAQGLAAPPRAPLWSSTAVATAVFWLWHAPA